MKPRRREVCRGCRFSNHQSFRFPSYRLHVHPSSACRRNIQAAGKLLLVARCSLALAGFFCAVAGVLGRWVSHNAVGELCLAGLGQGFAVFGRDRRCCACAGIGLGAAVVSAGVTTYLYLKRPERQDVGTAIRLAPAVGLRTAGLNLEGSF